MIFSFSGIPLMCFSAREQQLILSRLAAIEVQQRVQTQMLQSLLNAAAKRDNLEACELPEDVILPLESLEDLKRLDVKLHNDIELKTLIVS
jgi:CTP:phosphocholine cytidylyltransferase-like protein